MDKRIGVLVLMAGGFAAEDYVFDDELPDMRAFRRSVGDSALRDFYRQFAWDDPVHFVGRSTPSAVFLQFGSRDAAIPPRLARRYLELFGEPTALCFYDSGHGLDARARLDRVSWLAEHLRLGRLDTAALRRIPPLR